MPTLRMCCYQSAALHCAACKHRALKVPGSRTCFKDLQILAGAITLTSAMLWSILQLSAPTITYQGAPKIAHTQIVCSTHEQELMHFMTQLA